MATTPTPLGNQVLGEHDLGDGNSPLLLPGSSGLSVTFTAVGPGANGLSVTFSTQGVGTASLAVLFWVSAPILGFSINANLAIPWPQRVTYTPPQPIGTNQDGVDVLQGFASMTWDYDVLTDAEIATLMALYNPNAPQVTLTYLDEDGFWQQRTGVWQPPTLGTRSTVVSQGVSLTFTHLS